MKSRGDREGKANNQRRKRAYEDGKKYWHIDRFTPVYIFWFIFGLLCLRKTSRAIISNDYVWKYQHQVSQEALENSADFHNFLTVLDSMHKPPAILMLNQHAINMTRNFLCNTAAMPEVHERFVFVTLDSVAADVLRREWPRVLQFHWPTPALYERFSFAEGPYQLIYVLRANLAALLVKRRLSFWMMQQDTFWRENLFETDLESRGDYDLLFDQLADNDNSLRARVLNGANFYVRANNRTLTYFNSVADNLKHWYAADVAFMHHQCYTAVNGIKCDYMPFTIAHNWQWIYSDQSNPPYIIQLDCEMNYGTKLQTLASYGFNFTLADARTCNPIAVQTTRERMVNGTMDARLTQQSWGRLQFKAYYIISDLLIWFIPLTNPYGALMAYMLMITF